jgi:hypothetical protein
MGTAFDGSRCSGKSCGQVLAASRAARPIEQKLSPEEVALRKRQLATGLPDGLEGDAATKWAQQKLVAMLPKAVAQLDMDLTYGSEKVKSEAAEKVLRANGMDRREAATDAGRPTIILNIGDGAVSAPWLQRVTKKADK